MLYKRAKDKKLDPALFRNPSAEYRGTPFWAWNCHLDKALLLEQIRQFSDMGMGGAHIHCRVGLDTSYLGNDFFEIVCACEERMKEEGLLCWLYDEDRWPPGSAGGLVTREEKYRMRFLVLEPQEVLEEKEKGYMAAAKAVRSGKRTFLGYYAVRLNEEGYLESYRRLDKVPYELQKGKDTQIWCAWLEISGNTPWFNNQSYVNTLDKDSVERFIELTHESYYRHLGKDFGTEIPAIFTDEPQFAHKERLEEPFQKKPVILPFTDDFENTFVKRYGKSILDHLPELVWDRGKDMVSAARYLYHRHLCERFSEAYGDNIGEWCENHGICLTGHMMNEWTLHSQTMAVGEVMRPMMNFGLPGIDMLCDRRELSTAKQAQSLAHQMGREGVASEIYGVTGWDFDFRGHKLAGDWQAALGVTVRIPHLTWASMEGEAKRDYPASIGYQSPWYREYHVLEDYFARLNTVLTRGKTKVRVGVIHPVESYWLYWGCRSQGAEIREALEEQFESIISWLLYGLIDFDFISEMVLEELGERGDSEYFRVGRSEYEVILVPGCMTLRNNTYQHLEQFWQSGGKVIFVGEPPLFEEGQRTDRMVKLAEKCGKIPFRRDRVLSILEPYRDVEVWSESADGDDPTRIKHRESGKRTKNMFYQLREEAERKWIFLCHVNKPQNKDITYVEKLTIFIRGEYRPRLYDAQTGEIWETTADYQKGRTILTAYVSVYDSLLFELEPLRQEQKRGKASIGSVRIFPAERKKRLPEPEKIVLEEENCCLLDMAEYAFDDGEWQEEEELLKIDNRFRQKLNYPMRMEALAQPWATKGKEDREHLLKLRFEICTKKSIFRTFLAVEHPEEMKVELNGCAVETDDAGWYVDRSIRKICLGSLKKGKNVLELQIPFGEKTNVEWAYLLGEFGVEIRGKKAVLTDYPARIYYGDYTAQGLPFYAGNLIYETNLCTGEGDLWLEIPGYRGALLQVELDGKIKKNLIYAPYRLNFEKVSAGEHKVCIKVYGNRANAFGAVHHTDHTETWYGPNLWRTEGAKWAYEYQLTPMGVLTTPLYWQTEREKNE